MLSSLHIENVAVVKKLDLDLRGGFTVLTGETGAGKSIIIDCLNLLGGCRADKELIRTGETRAEISAVFDGLNDTAIGVLSELGIECEDSSVMLSRTIRSEAQGQFRVNGRSVTLSVIKEIASALFNIHGQNDNQKLFDRKNHLSLLDNFAGTSELLEEYQKDYRAIVDIRAQISAFDRDVMECNRQKEMLRYQLEDISSLKLKAGEEEELTARSKKLQSAEKIEKCLNLTERALSGGERSAGAIYLVDKAAAALEQLSDAITDASSLAVRLRDIKYELEDIEESAAQLSDVSDKDPSAEIDRIESRLDAISKLKRKYGQTVEEILEYAENARRKLDMLENSEDEKSELREKLSVLSEKARKKAEKIREIRSRAAHKLKKSVTENLAFLDMPKVRFEVSLLPTEDFTPLGLDACEFMIATNQGEPLMPMIKIASGGELARIMLSLKSVLNECDGIGTAVFDEIDTGISGKTSRKVGMKLKEISSGTQVICVTHSAQIASLGTSHIYISKAEKDGRVQTSVAELDRGGRVEEIARILGGIEVSDTQRRAAEEMIAEGEAW